MDQQDGMVDRKLAAIAGEAHGNVSREELLDAGITGTQIRSRLRKGSLFLEYPGVYRVGHQAPSTEASYMAAVKACGRDALLCGQAAAYLLDLLKGEMPPPEVVTTAKRRITGIITHRSRTNLSLDAWKWRGVPVTSPARTLVDIAASVALNQLARAFHEARIRYGTTVEDVELVVQRRPSSRGAKKLKHVIRGDAGVTLSSLERRFLWLLRKAGLPLPITNRISLGGYVDCRWPDYRLIVELDSYRYHASRHAWEKDRHRERVARAAGFEFRRYTYGDVFEHPRLMLAELRQLLAPSDPTLLVPGDT
jgi:very-short-patch-repair endonuclease